MRSNSLTASLLALPLLLTTGCMSSLGTGDLDFSELDFFGTGSDGSETTGYTIGHRVYFDPNARIETIAGTGSIGTAFTASVGDEYQCSNTGLLEGDGGPATDAHLNWPTGVAVKADGSILVADQCNDRVRMIQTNGIITTLARKGYIGPGPFNAFALSGPGGVEVSRQGHTFIVDTFSHTILQVGPDGLAHVIVGHANREGLSDYSTPVPVLAAELSYPTGVAEDSQGRLYIANYWGSNILRVDQGMLEALPVAVNHAGGLATDAQDNLYIVDNYGEQLLKMSPEGSLTRIAGNGQRGSYGDGGPATEAKLNYPTAVRVREDGVVFFTDTFNQRVAAIETDGTLYTVVGNGALQSPEDEEFGRLSGDNEDIAQASLNQPYALDLDADGNLLIADAMNNRIRKVTFSDQPSSLPTDERPELQ